MRVSLVLLLLLLAFSALAADTMDASVTTDAAVPDHARLPPFLDPSLVPAHDSPVHLDTPPLVAPGPQGGPVAGGPGAAPRVR